MKDGGAKTLDAEDNDNQAENPLEDKSNGLSIKQDKHLEECAAAGYRFGMKSPIGKRFKAWLAKTQVEYDAYYAADEDEQMKRRMAWVKQKYDEYAD